MGLSIFLLTVNEQQKMSLSVETVEKYQLYRVCCVEKNKPQNWGSNCYCVYFENLSGFIIIMQKKKDYSRHNMCAPL